MEKDKNHSQSYIEANNKIREMSEDISLENLLLMISEGGYFQFVQDQKIKHLNKDTKTYLFKYLRTQKLIKITDDKWYSVSDDTRGIGLGSFIYHNFKRDGDHHQDAIERFYVWWQNVVFNLDGKPRKRDKPLTIYNPELLGWLPRDSIQTLEFPFFSLQTRKKDLIVREFFSEEEQISIIISPNVKYGCMNILDKEILIYIYSMAVEQYKKGHNCKVVRTNIFNLIQSLDMSIKGQQYARIKTSLNRLASTYINTNIKTGNTTKENGFTLINWQELKKVSDNKDLKTIGIEVELSDWLIRTFKKSKELIALNPKYFQLKPFDRRLYEIVRKHCGHSNNWHIGLERLYKKMGMASDAKEFKRRLLALCSEKYLLEYQIRYSKLENTLIANKL